MLKRVVIVALLVLLLVAGFLAYRLTERIGQGKEAVDFALPSQRPRVGEMAFQSPQRRFRLADLQGKIVLVDVWATWCSPCIAAIPELVEMQERYGDDLAVVGLNVDEGGWEEVVAPFLQRRGDINYPVVRSDPPARILFNTIIDVPPLGKVSALPSSFLIDRQGRLVSKYVGGGTTPQVERDIQRLLQE